MNIYSIDEIENNKLCNWINITKNTYKSEYSEVFTPFHIAYEMINLLPKDILIKYDNTYLDAGCGCGNISITLYKILYENLTITNKRDNILSNMIHLLDINNERLKDALKILPCKNYYNMNFLEFNYNIKFDVIISNPPFIINNGNKKQTIWHDFVKKCILSLKDNGYLCIIIPSIWMKPEHTMYKIITSYKIHKIRCYKNNESNKIFNGDARTPLCYMLIQKKKSDNILQIWDKCISNYIQFNLQNIPIPMYLTSIINKIIPYVVKYGSIKKMISKTNCPPKNVILSSEKTKECNFENISTCKLNNKGPDMCFEYSNISLRFNEKRKLVLANKMYGIPYYDKDGKYGISKRDNYIYENENNDECIKMYKFLNLKFILMIYDATRYRMGYLEKYAFELIPNILNLLGDEINDNNIYNIFDLSDREIKIINENFNKIKTKIDTICFLN